MSTLGTQTCDEYSKHKVYLLFPELLTVRSESSSQKLWE